MNYPIELEKDYRTGNAVQWTGADGGKKTGVIVLYADSGEPFRPALFDSPDCLVIEYHSGELRILVESDLRPYPSEPIGQP